MDYTDGNQSEVEHSVDLKRNGRMMWSSDLRKKESDKQEAAENRRAWETIIDKAKTFTFQVVSQDEDELYYPH